MGSQALGHVDVLPGRVLALGGGAEHGNVGDNHHVVFGAYGEVFAEGVDLAQIVAEGAIVV